MKYYMVNSDIKYLNLGCGYRFDSKWTNINFVTTGENVIVHDLSRGIPFADNTFEVVYHSHVLEHFSKATAAYFIQECCRVLQPGGILRVVVPDLEQIARLYLESLEKASSSAEWTANHEWMTLELLDQLVRHKRGGDMANYLTQEKMCNRDFILERFGAEATKISELDQENDRLKALLIKIREFGAAVSKLMPRSLNRLYSALRIGYYRQSGEIHQWMYDHHSLSTLLKSCGLDNIVQRTAKDSYLEHWSSFNLDTESDGRVYKPDSLFIEAIKPANQVDFSLNIEKLSLTEVVD